MTKQEFLILLQGFRQQTLSAEELDLFFEQAEQPTFRELLGDELVADLEQRRFVSLADQDREEKVWMQINPASTIHAPVHRIHFLRTAWFRYAAAIIIILGSGAYLWITNRTKHTDPVQTVQSVPVKKDIEAPRTNRATLTLSNGQQIFVDSAASGTLAMQGNVQVEKTSDGRIEYKGQETSVQYNTLSVPRGSDIASIVLADGSKVFLNAASSLRYPVAFVGNERKVEITGEAYFEVAKNTKQPFIVETGNTEIKVLGTHFNVNAYAEEGPVKTTLLEGRVQVNREGYSKVLAPGQQESEGKIISNIDTESVMAWKNGIFRMEKADIATILRQVSRWYDVNVVYADGMIPVGTLSGEVSKQLNLSEVAEVLRLNGVAVQVEGTNLIVRKK